MNKLAQFKESLKDDYVINKKEYLLTLAVCILGGIVFGILFSPKGDSAIGSYNGNGCFAGSDDEEDEE